MCGVFGFVSNGGQMSLTHLKRIARVTETRGSHAFGLAWIDAAGRLRMFKQTGRISDHLSVLGMAKGARMLIGHCRFATHGDYRNNANNHPHPADGGWIVHNGVIPYHEEVIEEHNLLAQTDCDSEVLGLLIESGSGTLQERCRKAVELAVPSRGGGNLFSAESPLVMLGLWSRPGRLIAVRRGNPLHFGITADGTYLASLPNDMPGEVKAVRNNTVQEFTCGKRVKSLAI
jgi:glucosamine 6-phosphate synthetase-like amidotransferase/phosphosugar isomerase protein